MVGSVLFVLPAVLLHLVFTYIAFFYSSYFAFFKWNSITKPVYIGLQNFIDIFQDQRMTKGLKNSLMLCLFGLIIQNPLSLLIGMLLNRPFKTIAFLRTAFYFPLIVSMVVLSITWVQLLSYDGMFNFVLDQIGLDFLITDWLGKVDTSFPTLMVIFQWSGLGFCALIYLAGLQSIPKELFESADIDGASAWTKTIRITIPLMMPSITIVTFLILHGALQMFDLSYIMTSGGPGSSSYTISMAIFNAGFTIGNYGYSIAMGLVFMVFILIVSLAQIRITGRREVEY